VSVVSLVAFFTVSSYSKTTGSHYSLLDNLQYKLSHEDLDEIVVLGQPEKKSVPIVAGADSLMSLLASDPHFVKDHIWGRLAHPHPASTISFREQNSPSTHVLFRKQEDGSLKAYMHLDGNGPQRLFPHLDEFFFHKLTFRDSNQDQMHENLERALVREKNEFITRRERTTLYIHETLGLEPLATAFSNSLFRHYAHELLWRTEAHYEPMVSRFQGSMFRYTLRNSVELGIASWRQEDTRYKSSGEQGFKNRVRAAVVNAFVVPTPTGREFAYARFAAIIATTSTVDAWHPWRVSSGHPNYLRQATFGLMIDPLARSLWAEFRPKILRRLPLQKLK
jgi:hypothetical protein